MKTKITLTMLQQQVLSIKQLIVTFMSRVTATSMSKTLPLQTIPF